MRTWIDKVVADALGADPCAVVAHSRDTVVAYSVLCIRASTPYYPKLITLGSPLGIWTIRQQLATPLVSPPCVVEWFNAYDDRDVLALVPLDTKIFNVTPPIANKSDVLNFTDNRHGIKGYLADPVVAQQIVQWLWGLGCSKQAVKSLYNLFYRSVLVSTCRLTYSMGFSKNTRPARPA